MHRFFDILFSFIAVSVLSPLLLTVAVILKFTGEGEVFFLQERIGKDGKPFNLFKFATMLKNSPKVGTGTVTIQGDPRILPVGAFLRKSKMNELPQLFNIILGDMSIIGPRPQAPRCFNAFPEDLQKIIVKVKPGLSGMGAIVFRGEERMLAKHEHSLDFYDNVIAPYKGQVEAWYVEHYSLKEYFKIIAITNWVILSPKTDVVWRAFEDLPVPPAELQSEINYPVS